jgi:transposase-like protein
MFMNNGNLRMVRNESSARTFLVESGILRSTLPCRLCGSPRIVPAGRGRTRCRDCGFIWGLRRGSVIEGTHLTYLQFIRLARYFADDVPPSDAAERLSMDPSMADRMYRRIRISLLNGQSSPALLRGYLDDSGDPDGTAGTGGPVAKGVPVVFGIRSRHDLISIEHFEPEYPDILSELDIPRTIRGNILFIDAREKKYHGLIAYLPDRMNQETLVYRPRARTSWPPLAVFWKYADTVWARHRYMKRSQIPVFVQELAFRYNHRHMDMFHAILGMIAQHDYAE